MKKFSSLITEPQRYQDSDTNEIVGFILASACLAYAVAPVLVARAQAKKDSKDGGMSFWDFLSNRLDKRKEDKEKKKQENTSQQNNEAFNSLLMMAKKSNQKEKDDNTKKKNDAMLKILTACSFDKDGNEIPVEERIDKMKDTMSSEQFEAFKKDMTETYEKNKDNQDFKDALVKAKNNIKPEEYDKMLEDAKKEAKSTLEQLDKEKKDIEDYEKKLQDMEEEINGGDEKDKEIRALKKQLEELKNNPPQTITAAASGVSASGAPSNTNDDKPEDDKTEDDKQKEKTKEEIDKEIEAIEAKYKKQEDDLNKEYQDKIDAETDEDKKKELEKEWEKKSKEISSKKNKEKDDIDDADEHTDDDTKQGKYKVQDEEIEDPKTGEKIKVKTYTGPRGGKFYYPEGKPKTPENKVYVESMTLHQFMYELFY